METLLNKTVLVLLGLAGFLSLMSTCLASLSMPTLGRRTGRIVSRLLLILMGTAFVVLTCSLVIRGFVGRKLPLATMYEFTHCLAGAILLGLHVLFRRGSLPLEGNFIGLAALLVMLLILFGGSFPSEIVPLVPALNSVWLAIHVFTAVVAYASFAVAGCAGAVYLWGERHRHLTGQNYGTFLRQPVLVGFLFLTVTIITGSIWAEQAWGNWWSWDPKETWALITWLIYAVHLHIEKTPGWTVRQSAVMALLGLASTVFTFVGVSLLLPGTHSYL